MRGDQGAAERPILYHLPSHLCSSAISPLQFSRLHLLPRMVRGTNERTALHVPEAHRLALDAEHRELVGRDVAVERDMVVRGTQVLAEGEDVDIDFAQFTHGLEDLLVRLAHA